MASKLSPAMIDALERLAKRPSYDSITIYFTSHSVSTIQALERRGLVTVEKTGAGRYGWNRVKINKTGRARLRVEKGVR